MGLRLVIEYTADFEYTAGGTNILLNNQVEIGGCDWILNILLAVNIHRTINIHVLLDKLLAMTIYM